MPKSDFFKKKIKNKRGRRMRTKSKTTYLLHGQIQMKTLDKNIRSSNRISIAEKVKVRVR